MTVQEALKAAKGGLAVYLKDYPELTEQIEFQKIVVEALEKATHQCANCRNADYYANGTRVYCLEHACCFDPDNFCVYWEEDTDEPFVEGEK